MMPIYDAEFHPLIHTPVHKTQWYKCIKIIIYLLAILCIIGFSITDLLFAYSSIQCKDDKGQTDDMPIKLSDWFMTSGYLGFAVICFAVIFGCMIRLPREINLIVNLIPHTLMFTWLLIGNIVYWKNYYQTNHCQHSVIIYLIIRLYLGLALTIGSVYHEIKSQE